MLIPWEYLLRVCSGAQEIVLAAPYIKEAALRNLLANVTGQVRVVSRWTPQDIVAGATDIACRSVVMEQGGVFYLHPRLHAKYYRFDGKILVGSANLTATGLGYGNSANLEILCEPNNEFNHVEFERELFENAHEINDYELAKWQEIDTIPIVPLPQKVGEIDLDHWRPITRDPNHLWLVYRGQPDRVASEDEQRLAELDIAALSVPRGLHREQFNIWIAGCLLASPFMDSVHRLSDEDDPAAWYRLAEAWGISPSEAARARDTAQAWRAAFLA